MDLWDVFSTLVGAAAFASGMSWWQHAKNELPWPEAIRVGLIQATAWAIFFAFFQILLAPRGYSID